MFIYKFSKLFCSPVCANAACVLAFKSYGSIDSSVICGTCQCVVDSQTSGCPEPYSKWKCVCVCVCVFAIISNIWLMKEILIKQFIC